MRKIYYKTILIIVALFSVWSISAQSKFRDAEDGAFDVSDFLLAKSGFIAIPGVITQPAFGYGGYLSLLFFHGSMAEQKKFPAISGVMGGATENGTWGVGFFHMNSWNEDKIRYVGFAGKPHMNVGFYGAGYTDIFKNNPITITYDAWSVIQDLTFRIGASNFFIGGRYMFWQTDNSFDNSRAIPIIDELTVTSTVSQLAAVFAYDTRDNVLTPTKGTKAEITAQYSAKLIGSDSNYGLISAYILNYAPITEKTTVGIRVDGTFSIGDSPFYSKPFISMRGVPSMRYQNDNTTVIETEIKQNIYKRWDAVLFTGIGTAYETAKEFQDGESAYSLGTGFRYLIARKLGLQMGLDIAKSNQDYAFKVVFGNSWLR